MIGKKGIFSAFVATMLLTAAIITVPVVVTAGFPKIAIGWVEANPVTGVRAWDAGQNGETAFYLQNWMSNGTSEDIMYENFSAGTTDFYNWDAGVDINWNQGNIDNSDPAVIIINREEGVWAVDREGYVASTVQPFTDATTLHPQCILEKIPVPSLVQSGTDYAEVSWPDITDAFGLVAGYTLYRSTTNGSVLGEADWTPVAGADDKDNPITGPSPSFNDTGLALGTYYYAVKVVFTGYDSNVPANVNNYEGKFMGEGSPSIVVSLGPPTVDYIVITNGPDGPALGTEPLSIGGMLTAYASGYNNTGPTYVDLVEVDWSGLGGSWSPLTGTSSVFTAGLSPGTFVQTGQNGSLIDTFEVEVLNPEVDEIIIMDAPGGTGNPIWMNYPMMEFTYFGVGETMMLYAAGFNSTTGNYVMDAEVTWDTINVVTMNPDSSNGSVNPGPSTSTLFTANSDHAGQVLVVALNFSLSIGNITDYFEILTPTVDSILITDAPNGTELITVTLPVGGTVTAYASGYNTTSGYVGLVTVDWTDNGGSWSPSSGNTSTFTAGLSGGLFNQVAQNVGIGSDDFDIDILPPTVDYIMIVDTAGTGASEIQDSFIILNQNKWGFAASFNNTAMYIGDVSVTWTVVNVGSSASTFPNSGTSSQFDSGPVIGTATWTADDGFGHSDTVVYTIQDFTVDFIAIVNTAGSGISNISDQTVNVGFTITGYAAAFNYSAPGNGYIGDISVGWTVGNVGSSATTTPGPADNANFNAMLAGGTATWTANDGSGHTDDVVFTINDPTVDYILIVDTQLTGATEIPDQTVDVGFMITGYAASFNNTALYIGDVSVGWTVGNVGSSATTTPGPADNANFNAMLAGGTATWTADDGSGHLDTVVFTITNPTVDYILIVDTQLTGATEIPDQTVDVGFTVTGYAASFNNTALYIGDVSVGWTVGNVGSSATTTPGPADNANFNAMLAGGTATWTANDGSGHTDDVVFTINDPTVDYILIVDTQNTGATEIPDQTVDVGFTITGWAASFNNTALYIGDISVGWTVGNVGSSATTTPGPLDNANFNAMLAGGTATWTADDGSGHLDTVVFTIKDPTVDYILIVDTQLTGATEIPDQSIGVGLTVTGWAASFNNTALYIGDIAVDWTVGNSGGSTATTTPGSSDTTTFDSDNNGGTATWTADDGLGHSDTVIFTIANPVRDYIEIVDTAGTGATAIPDQVVNVNISVTGYAAAFNNSIGYLGDVSVVWSTQNSGGADATTLPLSGDNTTFNSGTLGGSCILKAIDALLNEDTVVFTINDPGVDYITIVDTAGTGATEIPDQSVGINFQITGYAAAFNNSIGYIGDIAVDWTVGNSGGSTATTTAGPLTNADFDSKVTGGTATWTADDGSGHTDTVVFTITGPQPDNIKIMDAADNLGSEIGDMTYGVYETDFFYLAAFNGSTYLYDIPDATWDSDDTSVGTIDNTIPPAIFTAQMVSADGTCVVTATFSGLSDSTGTLTVKAPAADYIQIRNAPDGLGDIVDTRTFGVGDTDQFYASIHNHTTGYIMDVSVIWSSSAATVGTVTTPGEFTEFEAQEVSTDSTCIVTATYNLLSNTTGLLTVLEPTLDEIRIRTAAGGLGSVLDTPITVNVDDEETYYAAGYNATAGYLEDILLAVWDVTDDLLASVFPSIGASTTFTADAEGTVKITVSRSGISNESATITIEAGVDTTPPSQPQPPILEQKGQDIAIGVVTNILEPDIDKYVIQRSTSPNGPWENITEEDASQLVIIYEDKDLEPGTKYYYRVIAVDEAGNPSPPSTTVSATTDPSDEFPWLLLILLLIIIVVVILLLVMMSKKKKGEEEVPPEGVAPAAAPMEEMPAEEEFAPEQEYEGGEVEEEYTPEETYEEETQFEEETVPDEGGYEEEAPSEEEGVEDEPDTPSTPPPPPPPPPA